VERDIRKNKTAIIVVSTVLFLISASFAASATTVSISDVFMKPNETAVTSIMINNVSNLGVADISLYFEPSVVHVISATNSDFDVFYPVINNTGGIVRAGGMDDGDGLYGDVKFADVTLEAVGSHGETSALNLSSNELKESGLPETSIPATVDNGTVFLNLPPVAIPTCMHLHNNVGTEYPCKTFFNASASYDPDGDGITNYNWYFGDGYSDAGPIVEHAYSTYKWHGTAYEPFNVSLTVKDGEGLANTAIVQVNVYIAGDANSDGIVDIFDGATVGLEWDEEAEFDGNIWWYNNPRGDEADLNNDKIVDIFDGATVGANWDHTAW
jgi:hypothetical protein